jgi:pimeloyl-ACP methyl ester carboxylesterase
LLSLVVGGGGTVVPLQLSSPLRDCVEAAGLEGYRTADPCEIVADALTDIEDFALPEFVRDEYLASYDGDRFVESMRYVLTYTTDLSILGDLPPRTPIPVQIIAGRRDPRCHRPTADISTSGCPTSKLDIIDARDSTWEDSAGEYAARVKSWCVDRYARASR